MTSRRGKWAGLRIAIAAILIYGSVALVARSISDAMIFLPEYGSRQEPAGAMRIATEGGDWVSAVHLPNPGARFTIWYFHGNGEALADIMPRLEGLRALGFAVLAVEYPGYGVSPGSPSERSVYAANRAAWQYIRDRLGIPAEAILLYGRSVGGGPAVELAASERVGGLVIESAFVSAYRVLTRWPLLPGDKFTNLRKLPRVRCPVLVVHGRRDEVIPFWHGEALYRAATGPKQHLWVDGAGHNDLWEWAAERQRGVLEEFAALVARSTTP